MITKLIEYKPPRKERKVAICPTADTDYLITDGIYRLTRNPMYLGMVTIYI